MRARSAKRPREMMLRISYVRFAPVMRDVRDQRAASPVRGSLVASHPRADNSYGPRAARLLWAGGAR